MRGPQKEAAVQRGAGNRPGVSVCNGRIARISHISGPLLPAGAVEPASPGHQRRPLQGEKALHAVSVR